MRRPFVLLLLVLSAAFAAPVRLPAQEGRDRAAEILRRVEETLRAESERTRREAVELLRRELAAPGSPSAPPSAPVLGLGAAKALATEDLLRGHAMYLASDELEGRCAGYPGNDKAAEYIAEVFRKAGLKPGGDAGGWFQKFRVGGRDTRNVIAVLEGTDPALKDETVVVGAHFDHVGTSEQRNFGRLGEGRPEDPIWNGADDNASGTSCLLALAKVFGEGRLETRRTLLFIAFSGEEAGLVGSRWYTNHPRGPIEKHTFMLNLDMVGRNPTRAMEIHGVGSSRGGEVRRAVEKAVAASGLKAKINDEVKLIGGDSDHSSFADKGVPYAFFFSGFHADYHRPSDHPEKLAYGNMLKVVHTSTDILLEMSGLDERPGFNAASRKRLNLPDLLNPKGPPGRRMGVTVQELDDDECDALKLGPAQGGLRVDAVQPGSPAELAGVKPGDVILSLAGTGLPRGGTRDELRGVLSDKVRPKTEVELVVLRAGARVGLRATWSE
jgi:hypothetical protein